MDIGNGKINSSFRDDEPSLGFLKKPTQKMLKQKLIENRISNIRQQNNELMKQNRKCNLNQNININNRIMTNDHNNNDEEDDDDDDHDEDDDDNLDGNFSSISNNTECNKSTSTNQTNLNTTQTTTTTATTNTTVTDELKITIIDENWGQYCYRIKVNTPFGKLINRFCQQKNKPVRSVLFWYFGRLVDEDDTPKSLNIKENEIILAHYIKTK